MSVIAAVIVLHTAYKASSDLVKWLQAGKRWYFLAFNDQG